MKQSLLDLLILYLDQMWAHLSVVIVQTGSVQHQAPNTKRIYLVTVLLLAIAIIHGIFGLHLEADRQQSLQHSHYIYWRQFILQRVWPQMDMVFFSVSCSTLFATLDLALKRPIHWQYKYTIKQNGNGRSKVKLGGKKLNNYQSTKLLAMFRHLRMIYRYFGLLAYSLVLLYSYGMLLFVSKHYSVGCWSVVFWIAELPFICIHIVLSMLVNLTHIILSGGCIYIRQQYLCRQFNRLLTKLTSCNKRPTKLRQLKQHLYHQYLALNHSTLSICQQLQVYNTFWCNYLTLIFAQYTILIVMFIYIIFYAPSAEDSMRALKGLFSIGIFETATLLFALIGYCARVVKGNGQIGKLNRRFAVHCLRYQRRYQLQVGQLLKLEHLQWPRLLSFYAFKLLGNSRITSQTFYAMAINISGFFLFVMTRLQ